MTTISLNRFFQWQASTALGLCGTLLLLMQLLVRSETISNHALATLTMVAGYMLLCTSLMLNLGAVTSLAVRQLWARIPQHLAEFTAAVLVLRAFVLH